MPLVALRFIFSYATTPGPKPINTPNLLEPHILHIEKATNRRFCLATALIVASADLPVNLPGSDAHTPDFNRVLSVLPGGSVALPCQGLVGKCGFGSPAPANHAAWLSCVSSSHLVPAPTWLWVSQPGIHARLMVVPMYFIKTLSRRT